MATSRKRIVLDSDEDGNNVGFVHHPGTVEGQIELAGNLTRWINRTRRSNGPHRLAANLIRLALILVLVVPIVMALAHLT
jgi:hypothetical protein